MSEADPVIWGLQHAFLPLLDEAAGRAFAEIGAVISPVAYLVGFPRGGSDGSDLLILEQEGSGQKFEREDLVQVAADSADRGRLDGTSYGRPGQGRRQPRLQFARDTIRARELEAAMQTAPAGADRVFFAGHSAIVGRYELHPVLSVEVDAVAQLPQLIIREAEGDYRPASLVHEVISELLRAGTQALLAATSAGADPWLPEDIAADVVRRAANHLVLAAEIAAGAVATKDLFETFEALASTAYEGRAGTGGVVLSARDHALIDIAVRLRRPVPVQDRRQFRKLLEMTGPRLDLLVDGSAIYGLGCISDEYDGSGQDVFRFGVVEQGVWQMAHHGDTLLQVAHGHPQLARPRISFDLFEASMRQVFPGVAAPDIEAIWRLAEEVAGQAHGTMLVISAAAEQEAARLAPESLVIEPQPVDSLLLDSMTRIDGAVLLTPDSVCHAVGVILDGIATGTGDAGRGARYNSAVRYATTSPAPCLIVIVSEDGMIDLHPEPVPQVRADDVERALMDLERVGASADVDLEAFYIATGRLRVVAAHLSRAQCARANAVCQHVAARHEARTGIGLVVVPFVAEERTFVTD